MEAHTRSVIPAATTPGSETTSTRVAPSRPSSQPASSAAPVPNLIGVASTVKTVSYTGAILPVASGTRRDESRDHRPGWGTRAQRKEFGMADRCLLTTWGEVVRGREERATECFNDTVGYYGRAQQQGKIEKFDTVLCFPNGRLDGYIKVEGTAQQLADMKEDREFQRL